MRPDAILRPASAAAARNYARKMCLLAPCYIGMDDLMQEARIAIWMGQKTIGAYADPTAAEVRKAKNAMIDAMRLVWRSRTAREQPAHICGQRDERDPMAEAAVREALERIKQRPDLMSLLDGLAAGEMQIDQAKRMGADPSTVSHKVRIIKEIIHG